MRKASEAITVADDRLERASERPELPPEAFDDRINDVTTAEALFPDVLQEFVPGDDTPEVALRYFITPDSSFVRETVPVAVRSARASTSKGLAASANWASARPASHPRDHSHFEAVLVERLRTLHDRISMVPVTAARRT